MPSSTLQPRLRLILGLVRISPPEPPLRDVDQNPVAMGLGACDLSLDLAMIQKPARALWHPDAVFQNNRAVLNPQLALQPP